MPDRGSRAFRLIPTVVPPLAAVVLVLTWGRSPGALVLVVAGVFLAAAVPSAVHHAEVIAHRVGEPFGSLVLAVAVTTIEVGLIVSLMVASPSDTESLARDTVYAALMITCNGIVGISLLASTLRERIAEFNAEGATTALATVLTLATLTLVLPTFTTATPGPEFSPGQLTFAAVASIVLYACFVFVQTVRHRDYFLPPSDVTATAGDDHTDPPTNRATLTSLALLFVALVAVVGLAKVESPAIEDAVHAIGAPSSAVGVVIAILVLTPESLAARCAPRAAAGCRTASTWPSARRWRASGSRSRRSRSPRSGSRGRWCSGSSRRSSSCSASRRSR
jgi:Ca2+:H+ antiporter